jgi:predicted NACHT family NTPase
MIGSKTISIAQEELIGRINTAIIDTAMKGLATVIGEVVGETSIKLLANTDAKLLDETGNLTEAAQDLLLCISRKYVENYTRHHGTLKVLGMGKPVSLEDVYTEINFHTDTIRRYQSIEGQEKVFSQRESKDGDKRPGLDIANQQQYLGVLGSPGTGKTTFLRKVGLEALNGKKNGDYQHTCIPVLLELRKFRSGKINLVKAIASEFENCGLPEYQECTKKFLEKGRLLILLDGLDQLPNEQMSEMTTQIRNLIDCYSDNRFIVSCRTAAYRHFNNFQHFTQMAIANLDDQQIETFIHKWFESCSQPEWGQQCWSKLNSGDHNATKELARTPLLLSLICILFKKRGEFPNKRATVYNEALWTLLSEWNASEETVCASPYKGMDTKCKEILLAEIAYDNFVADNLFFQRAEITQQIEQILREMLTEETFIDGRAVLRAIEEEHGILVEKADNIYTFSHLTFQEFLTAKHIVDNGIEIKQLVANHLCDRRWREVFLLIAGLKKADDLLLTMEKAIYSLVDTPKLKNLLIWVKQVTGTSKGKINPLGKRAIALASPNAIALTVANANVLALALANANALANVNANAYANTLANANANANADTLALANANAYALTVANANVYTLALALANANALANALADANANANALANAVADADASVLANALALDEVIKYTRWSEKSQIYRSVNYSGLINNLEQLTQQILADKPSLQDRKTFSREIIQIWLTAFNLTPDTIELSMSEIKALDNYFYANLLMVECKKAAVRVSNWNEIESRMLLPRT